MSTKVFGGLENNILCSKKKVAAPQTRGRQELHSEVLETALWDVMIEIVSV